jgi:TetR/AcrR family transcriptional regulator, transcriptional repressor for nem operon
MRDTRQELLTEAELLVRVRGYSGFSFAQLADAVGIRKASIHYYFRTKDDLAIALVAAYDARYDEALTAIMAASDDGLARIEAYGQLYLQGAEKRLGCLCAVLATEIDSLPERLREDLAAFFAKHVDWLERVLREGRGNRSIADRIDPMAGARMIVATLEGALMMERVLEGGTGFKTALEALKACLRPE